MIYMSIVKETMGKKTQFNLKNFYSSINCFLELLYLIQTMQNDHLDANNRINAKKLMNNIFKHDITRYMSLAVKYCLQGLWKD